MLLELVQDSCATSWEKLSENHEFCISDAIQSAKSRCTHDSFYHKLFFTLFVSSLNNTNIRNQLEQIIQSENKTLSAQLARLWPASPVEGVTLETWGVLLNAIVDGLAVQALIHKDFPVDTIYGEVETLFRGLSSMMTKEGNL
ncbi:TetR/AcrR family transcriptional regulator [Paenibacillus albiflavus]|uniref:TetR/AcrR family transcriptional regulator n=1 Tax=Paenibacillus albiflavus TaxID=2545760 RepID=A0A4R4ENG6_9BACL|nr:TetR/AcrR family transcriptional regulator [Paenibacillus albiflavus]TCZ79888.1 TetR/AcrR family transcriptional regulator [Paenibacillus albiflavus]